MTYRPTDIPKGRGVEFQVWLTDELRKVAQALEALDNLALVRLAVEPSKFAEALIIYADGTNFDPGEGAGPYYRSASGWVKMAVRGSIRSAQVGTVLDMTGDNIKFETITGNTVYTISNPTVGNLIILEVDGLFTITLPGTVTVVNGAYVPAIGINYLHLYCLDAVTPAFIASWTVMI